MMVEDVEETPSRRFLGTHLHPDNIPASFNEKKTKILVIFRNPKDTLVSFYHFSNNNPLLPSESWDSFYSNFMSGDGEKTHDLSDGIRQISSFFGYTLTEAQVLQISDGSTFSAMKQSSANSHGALGDVIFRKGEVGDWKNHFTPEQSREMDAAFNKQLAGTRLGAKLNYQRHCQCRVMQQKLCSREQERFRSLASLRAHLEYRHSYCSPDVTSGGFSITGKLPDPLTAAIPWHDMSLPTRRGQQRPPHSDTCPHRLNHQLFHPPAPIAPPPYPNLDLDLELVDQNQYSGLQTAAASAAVRRRLASLLRAADSTMQRRLAKVSTELAQTDTQLLCERAHSQHLAQERQEVADRERSLSRQVDVAVMVIAALREQLNASENELERQEREVITIQKFLEAAARQETCGKVRIQHFIENLLRRIALAERLVEYYQENSPQQCSHYKYQQPSEHTPHRITKSRSAGGQLSSSGLHDHRTHSHSSSSQFGGRPLFSRAGGGPEREHRERLAQSSRLFCRPEHRDDIWNHQRRRSAGYEA
ncbi:Sulfotransferase 6B1 [Dissostichus eleginoides]|uniref:Sulfotransferase n=1 Tax=Dissostichus eleginoides TaxID=100907 RepID=A0AAD9FGM4_DISEL|nr:Sulfotransferase 6B1 [Dissostichus eleginoides]